MAGYLVTWYINEISLRYNMYELLRLVYILLNGVMQGIIFSGIAMENLMYNGQLAIQSAKMHSRCCTQELYSTLYKTKFKTAMQKNLNT